jgi:hypothetical protein
MFKVFAEIFKYLPVLVSSFVSVVSVFKKDKPEAQPEPEPIEPQPIEPEPIEPEATPQPIAAPSEATPPPRPTAVEQLYKIVPVEKRAAFIAAVKTMCRNLGLDFDFVSCVLHLESRMLTAVRNPYTKATGLIQFMPTTANSLGTNIEDLAKMDYLEQLVWVEKYFAKTPLKARRKAKKSLIDTYLLVFYPVAIEWHIGREFPENVQKVNKIYVKNGTMTKQTIEDFLMLRYSKYI